MGYSVEIVSVGKLQVGILFGSASLQVDFGRVLSSLAGSTIDLMDISLDELVTDDKVSDGDPIPIMVVGGELAWLDLAPDDPRLKVRRC